MNRRKTSHTCIAICKNKQGKLMIAGDRRSSWGWDKAESMEVPKISKRDNILMGATGSGDLCSMFVDEGIFHIPEKKTESMNTYMFHTFKKAVHKFMISQTFSQKDNLVLSPDSFVEVVIGIEGEVWSLIVNNPLPDSHANFASEIQIQRVSTPYATGCGGIPALAVMKYEKKKQGYLTKQNLKDAVEIAAEISPGCDNVVDVLVAD